MFKPFKNSTNSTFQRIKHRSNAQCLVPLTMNEVDNTFKSLKGNTGPGIH